MIKITIEIGAETVRELLTGWLMAVRTTDGAGAGERDGSDRSDGSDKGETLARQAKPQESRKKKEPAAREKNAGAADDDDDDDDVDEEEILAELDCEGISAERKREAKRLELLAEAKELIGEKLPVGVGGLITVLSDSGWSVNKIAKMMDVAWAGVKAVGDGRIHPYMTQAFLRDWIRRGERDGSDRSDGSESVRRTATYCASGAERNAGAADKAKTGDM